MLTKDQLAARAEALPDGLPGEDLYARLFGPGEESFEQFKHDLIGMRRQAWPYLAFSSILLCITCMNPGLDLAGDLQGQTGFWQISYSKDYGNSGKLT